MKSMYCYLARPVVGSPNFKPGPRAAQPVQSTARFECYCEDSIVSTNRQTDRQTSKYLLTLNTINSSMLHNQVATLLCEVVLKIELVLYCIATFPNNFKTQEVY